MKVVKRIDWKLYKYQCFVCGKGFNWDANSSRYGKMEYKTIIEQQENEKYFCCDECWQKFKNENNIKS